MSSAWPTPGEIRVINGRKYVCVEPDRSYTVAEFFRHSGPGWDSRFRMERDPEYAMCVAGRHFDWDDVSTSEAIEAAMAHDPNRPYYRWVPVND